MQNRKYFPFERNSYYFGKLLTTRDFEDEQRYFNDKRRLLNRLTGSNGILSGLGVIAADDTSIVVQSGCALDASGREIVVPETRVIKLSTIDGYGQLTSDCAYLGISYEEQAAEAVYSVMSQNDSGQDQICNKIQEKYRLCLLDETQVNRIALPEEDFVSSLIVYADQEIVITQHTTKYVTLDNDSIVRVEIDKIGQGTGEYSFCYELDVPGFDTVDGENALVISMSGVKLSFGEKKSVSYRIKPRPHIWGGDSSVVILVKDLSVCKNDFTFTINKTLEEKMQPVQRGLNEQFLYNYYGKAMDKRLAESFDECLWIAKINLIRQGPSIILDRINPVPFGQYCYNAQQIMQLRALEQYYPAKSAEGAQTITPDAAHPAETGQSVAQEQQRSTACGMFELGLGLGYSTKDIILSDEIMHGLGKGPVCVEIGVEYITQGGEGSADFSEIYLGNMELFDTEPHSREERVYKITKAVKVLPERGTFQVAVRLGETSGLISLRIRWYAMRLSELNQQIRSGGKDNRYILVNPDTLVLPPKGTAHIAPAFINMPAEACNFRTTDAEGGTIDNNGVYTAPSKEGVYEIRVEAVSDPSIYTHVFAIVTQKKKE